MVSPSVSAAEELSSDSLGLFSRLKVLFNSSLQSDIPNEIPPKNSDVIIKEKEVLEYLGKVNSTALDAHDYSHNMLSPLHLAAASGSISICSKLIERCPNLIHRVDSQWRTPVMYAARKGHCSVVQLMIQSDCPLESCDTNGHCLLHLAASSGNADVLAVLVESGKLDVNARGRCRKTPLHQAAGQGNAEGCFFLLSHGAKAAAVTDQGRLPLHLAALMGHADTCQLLLDADPTGFLEKDIYGKTALDYAVQLQLGRVVGVLRSCQTWKKLFDAQKISEIFEYPALDITTPRVLNLTSDWLQIACRVFDVDQSIDGYTLLIQNDLSSRPPYRVYFDRCDYQLKVDDIVFDLHRYPDCTSEQNETTLAKNQKPARFDPMGVYRIQVVGRIRNISASNEDHSFTSQWSARIRVPRVGGSKPRHRAAAGCKPTTTSTHQGSKNVATSSSQGSKTVSGTSLS